MMILKFSSAVVLCSVVALLLAGTVTAVDQLMILHAPGSVRFTNTSQLLPLSHVADVILNTFGSGGNEEFSWDGLMQGSFYSRPKANVLLSIAATSADAQQLQFKSNVSYLLQQQYGVDREVDTDSIITQLEDYADSEPLLYVDLAFNKRYQADIRTYDKELHTAPKYSRRDNLLDREIKTIQHIINQLKQNSASLSRSSPDFFHFRLNGLIHQTNKHQVQSPESRAASRIRLEQSVAGLVEEFTKLYEGNVVIEALVYSDDVTVGNGVVLGRKLLQQTTAPEIGAQEQLNLAQPSTSLYPEMWNIIMWFMIIWILIVYGVAWCMWFTDPGSDGVIYRLTSQHVKQE
jgi:renin receptor